MDLALLPSTSPSPLPLLLTIMSSCCVSNDERAAQVAPEAEPVLAGAAEEDGTVVVEAGAGAGVGVGAVGCCCWCCCC